MASGHDDISQGYDDPHKPVLYAETKTEIEDVEKAARLATKIAKNQRRMGNIRVLERVINLLASTIVSCIMAYTLQKFVATKNEKVNGTGPFGSNPKLWPTYVMATVALLTLIFNLSVLLAYCCGRKAADSVASRSYYVKMLSPIGHLIVWGTTAGSFNLASDGTDIWAFSCSEDPSIVQIQKNFQSKVPYDQLCTINTGSWYTSLISVGFAAIGIIIWIAIYLHESKLKKMQKEHEAMRR